YPCDSMRVEVDTSTLPAPVKAQIGEGPKSITVDGVAYHVLGRMKEEAQKEDNKRRQVRLKGEKAKGTDHYVTPPDTAFAQRVLTPADLGDRDDRGRYFDDDTAGQSGIEFSQEDTLRGLRGL